MIDIDEATGQNIGGIDRVRQSVRRILMTPIGSCIERREFGSLLPELIDAPLNNVTLMQVAAASAGAIARWEPSLRLKRLRPTLDTARPGRLMFELEADLVDADTRVSLQIPIQLGGLTL